MRIVSIEVARPVAACWQVFTDPSMLVHWVPGLVDARLIETGRDGLPREVQFEFAAELIYSLVYSHDVAAHIVRWEPRPGEVGAVRGFARFEDSGDNTRFTYALEHFPGRKAAERALDDPRMLVKSFARYLEHGS